MANTASPSRARGIVSQLQSVDFSGIEASTLMPHLERVAGRTELPRSPAQNRGLLPEGLPRVATTSCDMVDELIIIDSSPGTLAGTTAGPAAQNVGPNEGTPQHPRPGARPSFPVHEHRSPPPSPPSSECSSASPSPPSSPEREGSSPLRLGCQRPPLSAPPAPYTPSAVEGVPTESPPAHLLEFTNMTEEDKLQRAKEVGFDSIKSKNRVKLNRKVYGKDFSTIERELEAIASKERKANQALEDCKSERELLRGETREMKRLKKRHRMAQFLQGEYRNNPLFAARVDQADRPSVEVQNLLMRGMCLTCKVSAAASTCNPCGDRVLCRNCARQSNPKKCLACRLPCSITVDKTYDFTPTPTALLDIR